MSETPAAASLLGGFVLAHAVWSVSDTAASELLAPMAIVEAGGQRTLQRFEAGTQVQAIADGKQAMTDVTPSADAWAFAREGAQRVPLDNPTTVDVIVVDFWSKGMARPATAIQRFERAAATSPFRILGDPVIVLDGNIVSGAAAAVVIDAVLRGVNSHGQVAQLWPTWRGSS